jgi:transcriptional regulator with XRE-family HTH domain
MPEDGAGSTEQQAGAEIRRVRLAAGLTLDEMAKQLGMGYTPDGVKKSSGRASVSYWERGLRPIPAPYREKYVELGADPAILAANPAARPSGPYADAARQNPIDGQPGLQDAVPDGDRVVVGLLPRAAFPLAGREDLLARLEMALEGGTEPGVVVLSGMGGVGKTSVAAEYAHRHLDKRPVAWQMRAEHEAVLRQQLAELAVQLGGRDVTDLRNPVAAAHAVLASSRRRWLLIFDNAPDEASVLQFLPPSGPGRVIITSQSQHWSRPTVLDVPVLEPDVATRYLLARTGEPDHTAARELADELGGLPLALEQAAAYMQGAGKSMTSYLSEFRRRRADLLRRKPTGPPSVAATLSLAISRLQEAGSPVAVDLLRLLSVLAPEPAPLDLLLSDSSLSGRLPPTPSAALAPLLGDQCALDDAIIELRRLSLVTLAGPDQVLVHRLVQHTTKELLLATVAREWEEAAAVLVESAVPDEPRLPGAWPTCAVLLPHARNLLRMTSGGMRNIAQGRGHAGSYAVAVDLFRQITEALEHDHDHGPLHPDTLSARGSLASWSGRAGDPAAARDQFAALAPTYRRVLGSEHPDTLDICGNLAEWSGAAGDPESARDQFAELVPIYQRVLGREHEGTLVARGNLATWSGRSGDWGAARDQLIDLVPVAEGILGPEHPQALTVLGNLAHWTGRAGDPAAARDRYADLALIYERVLGPEHPDTLTIRGNAARWTGEAGDPAAARDLLIELLPIRESVSGSEHPYTRIMRDNLTRWTEQAR